MESNEMMFAIVCGAGLMALSVYLVVLPKRVAMWHRVGAWAFSNRDAAITREERRKEYLSAEVAR